MFLKTFLQLLQFYPASCLKTLIGMRENASAREGSCLSVNISVFSRVMHVFKNFSAVFSCLSFENFNGMRENASEASPAALSVAGNRRN